jgi:hypothetical protein
LDFFGSLMTLDSLKYIIEAIDGSLPELNWTTLATTFPDFDVASRITKSSAGFGVDFTGLPINQNYALSISTSTVAAGDGTGGNGNGSGGSGGSGGTGGGTVAVPEPSTIALMTLGLLAFIRGRRKIRSGMPI